MEVKGILWPGVSTLSFDPMVNLDRGLWRWKSSLQNQALW